MLGASKSSFSRATACRKICAPCANSFGFGYASRKGAKTPSSEETNYSPQTSSLPLIRPLRLGAFAGDNPAFCCGSAALGLCGCGCSPEANLFFSAQSGKKRVLLSIKICAACANSVARRLPLPHPRAYAIRPYETDPNFAPWRPFDFAQDMLCGRSSDSSFLRPLRSLRLFFFSLVAALPR